MKVSVVIPCYGQAHFLAQAVLSIQSQTFQDWECLIVNDGSPDNTAEIAQQLCAADPRIKYLVKENGGLSSARNFGIRKANGIYILTLDADDRFDPAFVEKAVAFLDSRPDLGIVSCWCYRFRANEIIDIFKPRGRELQDYLFGNAAIGNSLFRKKCWEQVGGYDENMKKGYEDWDFYLRISSFKWKTYIIPEALFFYRQSNASMRTVAVGQYDSQIKAYIFKKNKAIYLEHYELTIDHFLAEAEAGKRELAKLKSKPDYRLGEQLLKPLRSLKAMLQWKK